MSRDLARRVLEIEAESIRKLIDRLDESFERAVDLVSGCRGRVVVTGMGKSGIIGRKIAATLNSHGDSLALSQSRGGAPWRPRYGGRGRRGDPALEQRKNARAGRAGRAASRGSRFRSSPFSETATRPSAKRRTWSSTSPSKKRPVPWDLAPTASTTASLALGDALAMAVLEKKGFSPDDFRTLHPNGQLGIQAPAGRRRDAPRRRDPEGPKPAPRCATSSTKCPGRVSASPVSWTERPSSRRHLRRRFEAPARKR